jgi:two-component system invasion response regulator UvrY
MQWLLLNYKSRSVKTMHKTMTKILIADDYPIFRSGVRQILSQEIRGTSISEAPNSREVMKLVRGADWDIVLLDAAMSGKGGLRVLKAIRSMRPRLPVLMLSTWPDDQLALRAIANGASGYLIKNCNPDQLTAAVEKLTNGGRYVSDSVATELLFNVGQGRDEHPHKRLSDREFEIMLMIAAGKSLSRIAEELGLSVKTVSTYRTRMLRKMGMYTNAELIRYAMKMKLVV